MSINFQIQNVKIKKSDNCNNKKPVKLVNPKLKIEPLKMYPNFKDYTGTSFITLHDFMPELYYLIMYFFSYRVKLCFSPIILNLKI